MKNDSTPKESHFWYCPFCGFMNDDKGEMADHIRAELKPKSILEEIGKSKKQIAIGDTIYESDVILPIRKLEIPTVISVRHPDDEWPKYLLDTMAKINELVEVLNEK